MWNYNFGSSTIYVNVYYSEERVSDRGMATVTQS